jgi:NTP pyrophosphatase (non-canonical NTP hydrolase)
MLDILDNIKILSTKDTKTLSQKGLKLSEECGELAKVILPYDNGFATTHRFVTAQNILEEVADTLLCSLSIAYSLGFDHDDIFDMIKQKSFKWSELQQKGLNGQFPLPFELHVTVELPTVESIELFKDTCSIIGGKPIVIDANQTQIMTSSVIITDNKGAYDEVMRISDKLDAAGFNVVRKKIETVPWHPATPTTIDQINEKTYFECHFNVVVDDKELEILKTRLKNYQVHFSRNKFKIIDDTNFVQMITFRQRTYLFDFQCKVTEIIRLLEHMDVNALKPGALQKHNIEYAIWDTNINLDTSWINGG